jgi:hypothetical protein
MENVITMSIEERRKYLHRMRIRYWKVKSKKGEDEAINSTSAKDGNFAIGASTLMLIESTA